MNTQKKLQRFKIGGILFTVFVLVYIPSLLNWIYGRSIATEYIRNGIIEDYANCEGFIVRDEEVLKSSFEGRLITEVSEGEKVPANYRLATVLNGEAVKLTARLKELDYKIIDVQREKAQNRDFFSDDILRLDQDINSKVKLLVEQDIEGSLLKTRQYREEIDAIINKRAAVMGESGPADSHLTALKQERTTIQDRISSNRTEIMTKTPGIISYSVDGYEPQLLPSGIRNITPQILEGIKVKESDKGGIPQNVQNGKAFAKIIKGLDFYIVTAVDTAKAGMFKVDDTIKLRINDINKTVEASVFYKSNEMNGRVIIAVRLDKGISETAGMRKINIDLIKTSYEGLKVPVRSILELDTKEMSGRIVLAKANYASLREVKIKGKNDEFAIIESFDGTQKNNVSLYDIYAVNPANIQEGQLIIK